MDKEELKDLNKRYSGTFIRYSKKELEDWKVIYVERVLIDGDFFWIRTINNNFDTFDYGCDLFKFDFSCPSIGIKNFKKGVILVNRSPNRQWRKGICSDNYTVKNPLKQTLLPILSKYNIDKKFLSPFNWSSPNMEYLYNNKYSTIKEALMELSSGEYIARAISKDFFMSLSMDKEAYTIYRKSIPVGEIINEELIPFETPFKQEVIDIFYRRNM